MILITGAGGETGREVTTLLLMFEFMENYGFWGNSGVLEWLLGRPPRRFKDWVAATARNFF